MINQSSYNLNQENSQQEEKQSSTPVGTLVISVIIFIFSIGIFLGLGFVYKPMLESEIASIQEKNTELDKQISVEANKKEVIGFYSQIENIKKLLKSHSSVIPIFDVIEKNTLSEVSYSNIEVDNQGLITMTGTAPSFDALASQLALYESIPEIKKVSSDGGDYKNGLIDFTIKMNVSPDILLFSTQVTNNSNP